MLNDSGDRLAASGSLYLAGFAQAGLPHAAIILASSSALGHMAHVTNRTGTWVYKFTDQNIANSLTLTSLIKIRDSSKGQLTAEELNGLLAQVIPPSATETGGCLNWVMRAVRLLAERGYVTLRSEEGLREEFASFCAGNRGYARTTAYPNVKESQYCS